MFGLFTWMVNKEPSSGVAGTSPGTEAAAVSDPFTAQRQQDRRDIDRFLGGEVGGFEDLMSRYQSRVYGIALGLTGNHDDAMDAMQKSFIRVHRSLHRFHLSEPFFPWLYRIVRNTSLNQKRNEKRHQGNCPLEWVTTADGRPDPLSAAVAADLRTRLWRGVQTLSPEKREVFVLYHFEGLKYQEIAATVGVPVGTVMSRLHAARQQLRRLVRPEDMS